MRCRYSGAPVLFSGGAGGQHHGSRRGAQHDPAAFVQAAKGFGGGVGEAALYPWKPEHFPDGRWHDSAAAGRGNGRAHGKTKAEISLSDVNIGGDIYIGGAETEGIRQIAKTVKSLRKDYPHIRFHFSSGHAEDLSERLDQGLFDIGIFIEPADLSKYDFIKLPSTDLWGVLMRKDCPLAAKETVNPGDLLGRPIITSNQAMVRNEMASWSGDEYEKYNIVASYNLLFHASLLVEEGVGHALCLDGIVKMPMDGPLCFRPLEPKLEVGFSIAWKNYQVFSKAAEKFLERVQADFI